MTLPPATPANADASKAGGSRLISRLLPPAIRLWLHSQLDHIDGLEFAIDGRDRQILAGYLPGVNLVARQAVYQGLHVSEAQVNAVDIRVNLPQVLRGKPLRLLQPFPVSGQVIMLAADLAASLRSPLLGQGLQDVLKQLVAAAAEPLPLEQWLGHGEVAPQVESVLSADRLTLRWANISPDADRLELTTGLVMKEGRWLCLQQPQAMLVPTTGAAAAPIALEEIAFDLGPEVDIQTLDVTPTGIELVGTVRVIPAD
ncbi:MAG: DUF2993 domain-containing protein [Cyanobacteria bacterium J06638_6]